MTEIAFDPGSSSSGEQQVWGNDYLIALCKKCDWRFLIPGGQMPVACPRCFRQELERLDRAELGPLASMVRPPELHLPFTVTPQALSQTLAQFAGGLSFAPQDLTAETLIKRLQRFWIPFWLVDAKIRADWRADAGFNYQVKSHQERYGDREGWQTQEVVETRQRWEARVGQLDRSYHNVSAQALDAYKAWTNRLGDYDFTKALPFTTHAAFSDPSGKDVVCLPDRSQQTAWPEAVPIIKGLAAEECRQACGADYIREFEWVPEYDQENWSLLLLPVYSTYYMDDENLPQQVLVHGQTGRINGVRKASMRKAQALTLTILMAALVIFAASLCLGAVSAINPTFLVIAGIGVLLALFIALGALYPVVAVWAINRNRKR